ncbi:MAG: dephospho-CoA kinase [Saprospiraceae bacterium]|nr:dephospho-CoA kinase [Saprospiraceae bacterium]
MLKVGITGGIATGKSFVCTIFKYLEHLSTMPTSKQN